MRALAPRTLEECARRVRRAKRDEFSRLRREVEAIVTSRITEVRPARNQTQTEESLRLASALMDSVAVAKAFATPQPPNRIELTIKELIASIAALGAEANDLHDRTLKLLSARDERNFVLQLDSLMIDASNLSAAIHRRKELRKAIGTAEEALAPFDDPSSTALKVHLAALWSSLDADAIHATVSHAKKHASQLATEQDANRARNAILDGLQDLGYEVHLQGDGWRLGERISVQRPDEPNYDIQLAAASDGRIQSKVRAYAHPGRSPGVSERDVEVEGAWCGDLKTLNERLETAGIEGRVDHEDAPGTAAQVPIERPSVAPTRPIIRSRVLSRPRP